MKAFFFILSSARPWRWIRALLAGAVTATTLAQPVITSQPADKTAVWGDRVTFLVGFNASSPSSLSWQFNGATLLSRTNSSLILTNVTFSDSGQYFAIVTDASGSVTSRVATLIVPAPVTLNPKVGSNIRLGDDPPALPANRRSQTEAYLSRSFENPNLLIATRMEGTGSDGEYSNALGCSYSVSTNGGLTWTSALIPKLTALDGSTNTRSADPVSAIDLSGNIFVTTLDFSLVAAPSMFISKSSDRGQSFDPPRQLFDAAVPYDSDKEWITINTFRGSPNANRIVVAFTREGGSNQVHSLYSDDDGATWSKTEPIPSAKDSSFVLLNYLPDGSLAALYLRYLNGYLGDANFSQLEFILSKDGGVSFGPPAVVQNFKGIAYRETLAFNWSLPSMTTDRQAGVLYVTYPVFIGPSTNRVPTVLFTKSIDKGATWTTPIAVNDTPDRRSVSYPTIAASPDGQHVTIIYYDRRNQTNTSGDYLYDLYLAESFDGGDTWQPNIRLTDVSSDLHKAPFIGSWRWVGDYLGTVPALNFEVPGFAAWVDTRNGNLDPYVVSVARTKGTTFETWRRLRFSTNDLANPDISGENADTDGDGIPNLLEYVLGLEPRHRDAAPLHILASSGSSSATVMSYDRLAVLSDIQFFWQSSSNLTNWIQSTPQREVISAGRDPSMQHVEASFPADDEFRFFRLAVAGAHAASTIQFAPGVYRGMEGEDLTLPLISNPPLTTKDASVELVQTGGTADSADFSFTYLGGVTSSGIVHFAGQGIEWDELLYLLDDGLPEGSETLELSLQDPSDGLMLGANSRITIVITNLSARVEMWSDTISEAVGEAEISVVRSGDTNMAFFVDYVAFPMGVRFDKGLAVPGVNFMPTNGTLFFAAGQRDALLRVPIIDNGEVDMEELKTFGVYLTNATAGVQVSTNVQVATIRDAQWPTTLDLEYTAPWSHTSWELDTFFWGWRHSPNGQLVIRDKTELTVVNPDDSIAARFPLILDTPYDPQFVVQPDGRVLIFNILNPPFRTINGVLVPHRGFARLNPDGSVDMTFRPAVDFTGQLSFYPIPLSDGRIMVHNNGAPVVLAPNGSLDNGFQLDPLIPDPQVVVEDAQGKLILAAPFPRVGDGTIFRLNRDGSRDTTFTSVQVDGYVLNLLIQPDGKILVETATNEPDDGLHLIRLNQDGSIDPAFKATVPGPADYWSILLLDGSKVLVTGPGPAIYRLNADGSLDKAFPVRLVLHSPDSGPTIRAMALQNGRLRIVGEFVEVNGSPRFGAARLLLDEAPITAAVIAPDPFYRNTAINWNYWNSGFQGMGDAQITVRRLGDTRGLVTLSYRTQDGSAMAGKDYTAVSGTLSFAPFEVEKSFNLPILENGVFEPDKALQLVLSPGSGVDALGPPVTFVIHKDQVRIRLQFDGSSWGLEFNSDPGCIYILEASPDLVRWELVNSSVAYAQISSLQDYGPSTQNQRFFRIRRGF